MPSNHYEVRARALPLLLLFLSATLEAELRAGGVARRWAWARRPQRTRSKKPTESSR